MLISRSRSNSTAKYDLLGCRMSVAFDVSLFVSLMHNDSTSLQAELLQMGGRVSVRHFLRESTESAAILGFRVGVPEKTSGFPPS